LLNFSYTKGVFPSGALTLAGNKSYGMAYDGGGNGLWLYF